MMLIRIPHEYVADTYNDILETAYRTEVEEVVEGPMYQPVVSECRGDAFKLSSSALHASRYSWSVKASR